MSLFVSCNDTVADIAEPISFAEHGKLVAESSEFHMTLSRAHKAHFSNSKYAKKRDILSEKRESGKALKKHEFTPESGNVDTYATICCCGTVQCKKSARPGTTTKCSFRR